jgi:hypothetical protein
MVPTLADEPEVRTALTRTESVDRPAIKLCVITAVAVSPTEIASAAASIVNVLASTAALDGATESIPKPNAAIAVIAIRLKNVVFDITFLSCVVEKTFSPTAGKDLISAS